MVIVAVVVELQMGIGPLLFEQRRRPVYWGMIISNMSGWTQINTHTKEKSLYGFKIWVLVFTSFGGTGGVTLKISSAARSVDHPQVEHFATLEIEIGGGLLQIERLAVEPQAQPIRFAVELLGAMNHEHD